MPVLKSRFILRLAVLGLCLVVLGAALIPNSKKKEKPGQIAGTDSSRPLFIDNKFCDNPSSDQQLGCTSFVHTAYGATTGNFQNVSGDVLVSGKLGLGDISKNIDTTGIVLGTLGQAQIEFLASPYAQGYGHKLYSFDPADGTGIVQLRLAARQGNTTWNDMAVFTSDGRVGIGQNWQPGAALQVTGTSNLFTGSRNAIAMYNPNPNDSSNEILFMGKGGASGKGWEVGNDIYANGSNNFYIADATPGKARLLIDEYGNSRFSGHLRLGETSGYTANAGWGNALYFSGGPFAGDNSDALSISRYDYGSDTSALRVNLLDDNNDTFEVGAWGRCCGLSDITSFWVRSDGTGYLQASAWTYGSDRRMKENIAPVSSGLDKIMKLNPVSFDYINGVKNNLGFIAQDVQPVIPEAISVTDTKTGMLGLKTDFIIPYLVKGMQEQQKEIEQLKKEVEALKTK